ncbi:MAG: 1,4-dihydroxy-2-naphthoate polyprenyltransferase [bacterium]
MEGPVTIAPDADHSRLQVWILAARPKTLWAAICPVLIGVVMAIDAQRLAVLPALAALWGAVWIQIGTNFANDYFDFKSGADQGERLGPLRVTQAGLVKPSIMKRATILAFGLATVAGAYLVYVAGWPILVIGLLSLMLGWLYTAGPYPLGYHGLGEIFVLVFFGPVAVAGTYYVQAQTFAWTTVVAGLAPGLMSVGILAVNNLRDADGDALAGKRTLAVRFGKSFAKLEYIVSVIVAAMVPLSLSLWLEDHYWANLTWLVPLAAIPIFRLVMTRQGRILNRALAATGMLLLLYTLLFAIGWLL